MAHHQLEPPELGQVVLANTVPFQISLPYQPDSSLLFESLRDMPGAALLDSSGYGGSFGRYDILCARPSYRLYSRNGQTWMQQPSAAAQLLQRSPFEALEQLLQQAGFNGDIDSDLPFCGGALGYFGYDLGRQYAPIDPSSIEDIGLADMDIGIYPWAIVVDHLQQQTQLVSMQLDTTQLQQLADELSVTSSEIGFYLDGRFQSNLAPVDYQQRFNRVIDYIHAGDCYQVNLAQRFSCDFRGDPWQAYKQLRSDTGTPFSAYLESEQGAILSLSPERFLQVNAKQVETRPIKGTRPRHHDPLIDLHFKQQLAESTKDRAENLMIVDLLRNDLGRSCITGSVKVPELFKIESYANVHHLVSSITGRLTQPIDAITLLRNCFPGGSITGAPKIRAMQIIEELEPHRRSVYCGSIGYISFNGRMDSNICIRTLVADRSSQQIHCWAGGGIVADSNAEAEYQETFDKVQNLLSSLEQHFGTR